jgi:2',3'-cyclic-nucleotide 2'-phosphodiesterase (5'-nucleotidase family)
VVESTVSFSVVSESVQEDPELAALVAPYRDQMGARIGEVIGQTSEILVKGWPEGTLGNFAADALLHAARARSPEPVDMALVNNGGLRIPIPEGSITVGQMFELMPFDNMISILTLEGGQVEALAHDIARRGGAPVSGLSFHILTAGGDMVASEIRVAGAVLDSEHLYRIAAPDYIANGGDDYQVLADAVKRSDLGVLVRDAFIEYLRERGTIRPRIEGRITGRVRR